MLKNSRNLILIIGTFCAGIFYVLSAGSDIFIIGTGGVPHSIGVFNTGGNAGSISFDDTPIGFSGAEVIGIGTNTGSVYLTGIFWLQTVGWTTFGESSVQMVPPDVGRNVRDPWYLSGYAWNPNAGWIALNHGESYASGVWYIPDTRKLIGFGYSQSLGWIPFGVDTGSGIQLQTRDGFIGRVSVQAGIGGSKAFNVLYDVGSPIQTISLSSFLNVIRKNVTILIRNAGGKVNTDLTAGSIETINNATIFRKMPNDSNEFLTYSSIKTTFDNDASRSLIVIGADIYIDTDMITPIWVNQPRGIIALKNAKGQGGNIWIKGSVKEIQGIIFAEGSLFSGEEFLAGNLSPYFISKASLFTDIPKNQLYIKGSIGSYNTIGGSAKDGGAICPTFNDLGYALCTYDNAIKYDMNYFRIYDKTPARRAYKNASKDEYSIIIEHDPRSVQFPPPGLETLK